MDEREKFEKKTKKKKKLMGNMAFIAELHLLKYLPIKVIRFITYNLILSFAKGLLENRISTNIKNNYEEDYLEA